MTQLLLVQGPGGLPHRGLNGTGQQQIALAPEEADKSVADQQATIFVEEAPEDQPQAEAVHEQVLLTEAEQEAQLNQLYGPYYAPLSGRGELTEACVTVRQAQPTNIPVR